MKILYISQLEQGCSARARMLALQRMGYEIVPLDTNSYATKNRAMGKLAFLLAAGPNVQRLNRDLLRLAAQHRPDLLWADKVLQLQPATVLRCRAMGIQTVCYMIDNAFGPRRDSGLRLYKKTIPCFDLHCTQRDVSVTDLKRRGAREVIKIQTAYDRAAHYPPPQGWSDADRDRDVSFIGFPYDDRAQFLTKLSEAGLPVVISGPRRAWKRVLTSDNFTKMFREGELWEDAYREGIWRSKINLSFITKSNQDEFAHKSFEIAGCGGFLVAERSEGHTSRFVEDKEAVFFSTVEECMQKIRLYLPDEASRMRIGNAGRERAERDGYHNDHQLGLILDRLQRLGSRSSLRSAG
jgi:spore maturation protein CgeB